MEFGELSLLLIPRAKYWCISLCSSLKNTILLSLFIFVNIWNGITSFVSVQRLGMEAGQKEQAWLVVVEVI